MSMTKEQVRKEAKQSGKDEAWLNAPTHYDEGMTNLDNWMRYGHEGELLLDAGSKSWKTEDGKTIQDGKYLTVITDKDGRVQKIFKDAARRDFGESFNPLKYVDDNQVVFTEWQLADDMLGVDRGIKAIGEKDGYYTYVNNEVKDGIFGKELGNLVNQLPDWSKPVVEAATPIGWADAVTGGGVLGSEFYGEALSETSDATGIDPKYIQAGVQAGAMIGAAATGQWWAVPALVAAQAGVGELTGRPADWESVAFTAASSYLTGNLLSGASPATQSLVSTGAGAAWNKYHNNMSSSEILQQAVIDLGAGYVGSTPAGGVGSVAFRMGAGEAFGGKDYDPLMDVIAHAGSFGNKGGKSWNPLKYGSGIASDFRRSVEIFRQERDINRIGRAGLYDKKLGTPVTAEQMARNDGGVGEEILPGFVDIRQPWETPESFASEVQKSTSAPQQSIKLAGPTEYGPDTRGYPEAPTEYGPDTRNPNVVFDPSLHWRENAKFINEMSASDQELMERQRTEFNRFVPDEYPMDLGPQVEITMRDVPYWKNRYKYRK